MSGKGTTAAGQRLTQSSADSDHAEVFVTVKIQDRLLVTLVERERGGELEGESILSEKCCSVTTTGSVWSVTWPVGRCSKLVGREKGWRGILMVVGWENAD